VRRLVRCLVRCLRRLNATDGGQLSYTGFAMAESASDFQALENVLGYVFKEPGLCRSALTHKSWVNEQRSESAIINNERLEFLGDAVLGLAVSDMLMQQFPEHPEGQLSKMRAALVNEIGLSKIAEGMNLGQWIFLGKGELLEGGRVRTSILANAVEAIIGAVHTDAGFEAASQVVRKLVGPYLNGASFSADNDFKSRLQELAQAKFKSAPTYATVSESGPEHEKLFEIAVFIVDREYARASGRTKKAAQQLAAARALDYFGAAE
jgi:ribonuclease III